jgi:hypothetical protein
LSRVFNISTGVWSWCWWPPWKFKLPICDYKIIVVSPQTRVFVACITKKWYLDIGWTVGTIPQYH